MVALDTDPYESRGRRPALVISDDKHPDRYRDDLEDPSYTAALLTTGFYADNAWSIRVGYKDLQRGKALSRRNSHVMLWAIRPIYESEIEKRIAQVTDGFLRTLGAAFEQFLDPDIPRL